MNISIRQATIHDLPSICRLSQDLFDYERRFTQEFNMRWSVTKYGRGFFARRLSGKHSFILLAFDGRSTVTGYILVNMESLSWRMYNPIADIVNLSIAPEYRRKGVGTLLLNRAKDIACSRGAKRICVTALTGNDPALHFYRQKGFGEFSTTLIMNTE